MNKLTRSEKILFVLLIIAVAVALSFVLYTRVLDGNNSFSITTYDFDTASYDVQIVNNAAYEDFLQIKGMGESKAKAIVDYREALGGFTSVYQLKDLSGISDNLFDTIIEHFYSPASETELAEKPEDISIAIVTTTELSESVTECPVESSATESTVADVETEIIEEEEVIPKEMSYVDINNASAEEISEALLIDISIAREIVELREFIGGFSNYNELILCESIDSELLKIIAKYLIFS